MREHVDVPGPLLRRLRAVCGPLPGAEEQQAWVGTRWRVRGRTFAHAVWIEDGWPPAYVHAFRSDGPLCVVTFECHGEELAALRHTSELFFAPPWRDTVVGLSLGDDTDWDQLSELVTQSYLMLAPKGLTGLVAEPTGVSRRIEALRRGP